MTRLYDHLLRYGFLRQEDEYNYGVVRRLLPAAIPIDVSNVTDYLSMMDPGRDPDPLDLPNLVPPFEVTFIESRIPAVTPEQWPFMHEWRTAGARSWGVLLDTMDCLADRPNTLAVQDEIRQIISRTLPGEFTRDDREVVVTDTRWVVRLTVFMGPTTNLPASAPIMTGRLLLQPDGRVGMSGRGKRMLGFAIDRETLPVSPGDEVQYLQGLACCFLGSPLLGIGFAHCRNVQMVESFPTRQQRRDAARRGVSESRFYTLQIDPMKQALRTQGGAERHGLKKALHICRGHFATYTEERPLFGKRAGTFWIPAHVRGSADAGLVGKDYAVKAPKDAA